MLRSTKSCFLLAIGGLVLSGCGGSDGLDRVSINGTVTAGGSPLDSGALSFIPVLGGPATGAAITAGTYEITADRGPTVGE